MHNIGNLELLSLDGDEIVYCKNCTDPHIRPRIDFRTLYQNDLATLENVKVTYLKYAFCLLADMCLTNRS